MESDLDTITPDVLNAISCSGLPPHQLTLKVGVPVMLLRNIDQSNGLCNGTRLQGQTLTTVGLYLPRPVFSHGQLYVALSRVKSKNGLRVLIQNNKCNVTTSTINVVYREIFENIH
ncbi:uncharacterized protein [Arachis hypogaea]|uniref:uncharacterized protein n=1 Tax=Arachis hypogaea TaxID=3818 RepID=UPI000DEC8648